MAAALRNSPRAGFWLLIGLIALFAAAKPILFDTLDPDCFWHLRVAAQLHRDGIGPLVDHLSFASSPGPWTPYSWLAELGMKAIWDTGGYRLAIAFTACMQAMILVLLAMVCRQVQLLGGTGEGSTLNEESPTGYLAAAVATAIGAFLILPYLSFRPVTAGFLLLFSCVWLIVRDMRCHAHAPGVRGLAIVWIVVPLTALFVNIHLFAFFVPAVALAMAIGAWLQRDAKGAVRYGLLATATSLACLATPMLPGVINTLFYYSATDKMVAGPVIVEMQSFAHEGWIPIVGVGLMIGCIIARRHLLHIGLLICLLATTALMFKLGRFAPLFALAACPALAATLPGLKDRLLARPAVVAMLAAVLAIGIFRVTLAFPRQSVPLSQWINRHGPDTPGYPCAAADFVDRSLPQIRTGHLINEFSWGGYLAWRLGDKYQVLLDGRTQVYPPQLWHSTYLGNDTDRRRFLSTVSADAAIIPAQKSLFRQTLLNLGWQSAFKDDRAEVLLPPKSADVAHIE
jgi:hypothetical protein